MTAPRSLHLLHSERGISMAELLMVVVVAGLMVAMVATKIDISHFRVDASMRTIGTTIMSAQREAVATQVDVIVRFDSAGRKISIHWDTDGDHVIDAGEKLRTVGLDEGVQFGRPSGVAARAFGSGGINFSQIGGTPALVFHRNGSANESGGFYLTSTKAATTGTNLSDTRSIELERATGRAEWFRYQGAWRRGF